MFLSRREILEEERTSSSDALLVGHHGFQRALV